MSWMDLLKVPAMPDAASAPRPWDAMPVPAVHVCWARRCTSFSSHCEQALFGMVLLGRRTFFWQLNGILPLVMRLA